LRFESPGFALQFLPVLLAAYFLTRGLFAVFRASAVWTTYAAQVVLTAASAWIIALAGPAALVLGGAMTTLVLTGAIAATRGNNRRLAAALVAAVVVVMAGVFVATRVQIDGRSFAFLGVTIVCCHAIAYAIDVYRGEATARRPLTSALYLLQFPVLPAGPIVRSRDFAEHHMRLAEGVSLGGFTYGMRRFIIGLVKVGLVAGTLGEAADTIFKVPTARLSIDAAWLGAVSFALQIYFLFSGYADIAIGVGKTVGLRYPENFRRPYVADSVREFWRRWNITSIMWLRDYLSLPIAGRDAHSPRLFGNTVIGFLLLGLWHGGGRTVWVWALYSAFWLALEAVGLGQRMERLPRAARHAYVLLVILVGWVILRADQGAQAWTYLQVMAGIKGASAWTAWRYLTPALGAALLVAVVGAGPIVPWISRWRVTLDATTAAVVMMMTALSLFVLRGGMLVASALRPIRARKKARG
jgi:alginate O-acetyltransferase complex protein AlgI